MLAQFRGLTLRELEGRGNQNFIPIKIVFVRDKNLAGLFDVPDLGGGGLYVSICFSAQLEERVASQKGLEYVHPGHYQQAAAARTAPVSA